MATTTTSTGSTTTQARYDSAVSKYWQAKVDAAMRQNKITIGWSVNNNLWTSSGNTAQQNANIAKANEYKASWPVPVKRINTFTGKTETVSNLNKINTAQQDLNIAKAKQFQQWVTSNSSGSILKSVDNSKNYAKNQVKLMEAVKKLWYDTVEKALNAKWMTIKWSDSTPLNPAEYTTQSWQVKSNLYELGKEPDSMDRLTAEQLWYEKSLQDWADKVNKIKTETAEKENELLKKQNKEKEERASLRESQAQWLFTKYDKETEESKKAIAENLNAMKRTQSIAANAAAAQAGQWAWLSEWARQQVESDIANRFAANVNEATSAAITQTQWLTEAQKNTGIQWLSEQDKVDLLMNNMNDTEWQIFVKLAQEIWLTKALAQEKYNNYLDKTNEEQLSWTFNRAEMQKKVDSWNNSFNDKDSSPEYRAAIIEQIIWGHPSYNIFRGEMFNMIREWKWFQEIIDTIYAKAENNYRQYTIAQNVAIQDKSVIDPVILKWVSDAFNSYK